MKRLCDSEFWNLSITWNTSNPDFTPCFQDTLLVWIPCFFLWIFLPLAIHNWRSTHRKDIGWTTLNFLKTLVTAALTTLSLADLSFSIHQSTVINNVPLVFFLSPVIRFITMVLAIIFIQLDRRKGIHSSGILFFFWLLLAFFGVITFRTHFIHLFADEYLPSLYLFISYMIYYPLIIGNVILACIADVHADYAKVSLHENPCPELNSSFLSQILFWWFNGLILKGYKKPLVRQDLWDLNPEDRTTKVFKLFENNWEKELLKNKKSKERIETNISNKKVYSASFSWALVKTYWSTFIVAAFFKVINDILTFMGPIILRFLIEFTEDKNEHLWKGILYAFMLFASALTQTIVLHQYFHRCFIVGMRVRASIVSAVFKKALKLSNTAKKTSTVGEVVNLMAIDAQKFIDLMTYLNVIWSGPLQIIVALILLYQFLGPSVFAGLLLMLLLIPVNAVLAAQHKKLQTKQMKQKDSRIKFMNEVLNGIKVLKLYAWEKSFLQQITDIRNKELKLLRQSGYLHAIAYCTLATAPVLVAVVTFATYVLIEGKNLDAQTAFVSLSLFNVLRFPLFMFPQVISQLVQVNVSIQRLSRFLKNDELDPDSVQHDPLSTNPITIENGTFAWDREESPILKNINMSIKKGQLIAVVGQVGSGKSSLLNALLGEMEKLEGKVNVKGAVAYVPQQAWIQNSTLKDNILFDKHLDHDKYLKVINACALGPDLEILPGKDLTEIGEKGINLSGGQKQRVSLARAVYQDCKIYYLDDPLSAVDSHVGKHIFDNVIGPEGLLRNKTRILVTHGISYLPKVDQIIVIVDGEISEMGSYKELLDKNQAFAEFLRIYLDESEDADDLDEEDLQLKENLLSSLGSSSSVERKFQRTLSNASSIQSSGSDIKHRSSKGDLMSPKSSRPAGTKLIQLEATETGEVKLTVYILYLKYLTFLFTALIFLFNIINMSCSIGSSFWLSYWSEDIKDPELRNDTAHRDMRIGVYAAFALFQGVVIFFDVIIFTKAVIIAASFLHSQMLGNVVHAPMSFFDTTPLGRIVNRFSKDIDTVDLTIPQTLKSWISCLFGVISTLIVISYATPIFLVVVIPLAIMYYFIQRYYITTSRQLKRLESVSRSPIFSHFQESLTGAVTIRAYNKQDQFIAQSEQHVDENQVSYYPHVVSNRWLAVRLELIANFIVLFAALFAVLSRDSIEGGLVGLSVSNALNVTQVLNWFVRQSCELETNIVAVERLKEYSEIETEAPYEFPNFKPDPKWPTNGIVKFNGYKTRYRSGLDLVIKGISCEISSSEKIGIVGRTGAGKSSLTLALFRIIEASEGIIMIDNLDISTIGLYDLRSKLTIIPQDPVLFSGTLRFNLDPFQIYSDKELWSALELSHLKTFVTGLSTGLGHEISEGGENLSIGQRQLVCLARALLRKTKVLVLDEATAAVDLETDDLIQQTIRKEFKDCTILTIAHRLNTIMDSDRLMVLDKGCIAEFDSPANLLSNQQSIFYSMAKDANLIYDRDEGNRTFRSKNIIAKKSPIKELDPGSIISEKIDELQFEDDDIVEIRTGSPSESETRI